jgi:hypothetical protein
MQNDKVKFKNESERIFEQYLDSNGFQDEWIYEPDIKGKKKRIDYLLNWREHECFFEVKELRKKPNEPTARPAYIDPYSSLRAEINEARKKFKEYKEYSCSLVVYNVDDKQARLKPIFIFGAMLGNLGISADLDAEKGKTVAGSERNAFLDGGKMINYKGKQPQNTTISSIVILEEFHDNSDVEKALREKEKKENRKFTVPEMVEVRIKLYENHHVKIVPRLIVVENPFAREAFSEDLFNGPFDEHWRWIEEQSGKIERIFTGNKLKELKAIKGKTQ